uniref:Uncharacterized protein n=1 Tax=Romanomermis culicivorax TaxID=13658 RepID=A0A915KWN8_ROMCU
MEFIIFYVLEPAIIEFLINDIPLTTYILVCIGNKSPDDNHYAFTPSDAGDNQKKTRCKE